MPNWALVHVLVFPVSSAEFFPRLLADSPGLQAESPVDRQRALETCEGTRVCPQVSSAAAWPAARMYSSAVNSCSGLTNNFATCRQRDLVFRQKSPWTGRQPWWCAKGHACACNRFLVAARPTAQLYSSATNPCSSLADCFAARRQIDPVFRQTVLWAGRQS